MKSLVATPATARTVKMSVERAVANTANQALRRLASLWGHKPVKFDTAPTQHG